MEESALADVSSDQLLPRWLYVTYSVLVNNSKPIAMHNLTKLISHAKAPSV